MRHILDRRRMSTCCERLDRYCDDVVNLTDMTTKSRFYFELCNGLAAVKCFFILVL